MVKKIVEYLKDVKAEMAKVSWPGKEEVIDATVLVTVFSLFFAVVVFAYDKLLTFVLDFFLR